MSQNKPIIKRCSIGWLVIAPNGNHAVYAYFSSACAWAYAFGRPEPASNEWGIPQ